MNCWIVLLLLCCCNRNNCMQADYGCDCECHSHHNHSHNSCIQPGLYERSSCDVRRERDCDCDDYDHNHAHNDSCGCAGDERVREKWMPYSECNDNDRRDCGCK